VSEIPAALQAALAGRYDLDRVVGHGGMATVYLARDPKHNRMVALKVLKPDVAASIGADRFLREIEIAARLQHPHVLTLIDSGEAKGFLYYVMPYIAGESLRTRLVSGGPVPLAEAVHIAREVADALEYAHRLGLVHRDIKPENILFSEGHAIVTDFGIAKALSLATGPGLTRTGYPVGTPGYMSPEQALAADNLDARTDVFSLAAVVYEMLVGELPGMWVGEEELRLELFQEARPAHRARLDALPGGVEHALVRAMAMRPARRHATPGELVGALEDSLGRRPRYPAERVREIVNRAAVLEARPTAAGSMTIGGIERLASEVGIPPAHVREAARVIAQRAEAEPPKANFLVGTPSLILLDREVEGEVPEAEFIALVEEMRRTTNNVGMAGTLGRSLAWHTTTVAAGAAARDVHVTVTPRNGRTRIHVEEKLGPLVGAYFGGLVGGWGGGGSGAAMGIGMGALNSPVAAVTLVIANLAAAYFTARAVFRNAHRKRLRDLTSLIDRLAEHCADTATATLPLGAHPRPPGLRA